MSKTKTVDRSLLQLPMQKRALMAFREAVDEVVAEHARLGLPIYILRDGKVVAVPAQEIGKGPKSRRQS